MTPITVRASAVSARRNAVLDEQHGQWVGRTDGGEVVFPVRHYGMLSRVEIAVDEMGYSTRIKAAVSVGPLGINVGSAKSSGGGRDKKIVLEFEPVPVGDGARVHVWMGQRQRVGNVECLVGPLHEPPMQPMPVPAPTPAPTGSLLAGSPGWLKSRPKGSTREIASLVERIEELEQIVRELKGH